MDNNKLKIPDHEMRQVFERILLKAGYEQHKAEKLAEIFTVNSLEGVYSHGVNRFARFIRNTYKGYIIPDAEPVLLNAQGVVEQWDGKFGPGPLNALFATSRAMDIASREAMGMVSLSFTNHWMRAGYYGWMAALKGYILICWTNTCPNMPAWGARDPRLGNNPLVLAVPWKETAIVLDMAMSQYSYGKMESYRADGLKMPFTAGFDSSDNLTDDPGEVLDALRPLPAGLWKGSGLSLLLDILAAVISGGRATWQVADCSSESGLSQVFIAINPSKLYNSDFINDIVLNIVNDLRSSEQVNISDPVRYPGENIAGVRNRNLNEGIPVNKSVWEEILTL